MDGPGGAPAVQVGDVVTAGGRPGVWRVLSVRHGVARLAALAGTGAVTGTSVPLVGLVALPDAPDDEG